MKILSAFLITILLISNAFACRSVFSQELSSNFHYNNKNYRVSLSIKNLYSSSDFNIEKSEFPKQIYEIIQIAKGLMKRIDSEQNWGIQNITLNRYNYNNATYWYYQINLRANNVYTYLNIGINGEQPNIYRIDEVLISQ